MKSDSKLTVKVNQGIPSTAQRMCVGGVLKLTLHRETMTYLHFTNVGPFVVEALEKSGDAKEAPHPVVHYISNSLAIRRKSDLYSAIDTVRRPENMHGTYSASG